MTSGRLICRVCGGKNYAGGLCHVHHRAAVNAGQTILLKRPSTSATKGMSVAQRLAFHGQLDAETGCINWTSTILRTGYGQIRIGGKGKLAHRVAYEIEHGPLPEGVDVLHHCDNRRCVNTDHHFTGTHADNMEDRNLKDRQASVLTREEVVAILADTRPHDDVAAVFGTKYQNVLKIRRGQKWKHVPRDPAQCYESASRKLSDAQVRLILQDTRPNVQIATAYGVTRQAVWQIKKGKARSGA